MTEQAVNRMLTNAYIQTMPKAITLMPHSRQDDDTGGWFETEGPARVPQAMRLIEPSTPAPVQITIDGTERTVEFELLAAWDAQMAVGDRFTLDGLDYELTRIWPENGYERRAWVVRRGA